MPFTNPESRRIADTCFDEIVKVLKARGKMQPDQVLSEVNSLLECARVVLTNVEKKKNKKPNSAKRRKVVTGDDDSEQEVAQQESGP